MKKRILACALALLLMVSVLVGCSEQMPLVYVQSVAELIGYGSIGAYNSCAGVVLAQEETSIEKDESRKIKSLSVEVGQYVNEGDILFTYDTSGVDLEVSRLKLEMEQLKNTISDLKKQIAQLEKEKKNTKDEDTKLAYTLQIQSLQNDQSESEYYLALKQNEIDALNSSKDTGEVRSPINGEVKAINENGGYDPFTGMPLPYITLSAKESFRIKGTVNELSRDDFYVGQAVVIRSRVDSKLTWTGVITEIDMQAEDNNDYYYGMDEMYSSSSYPFYVQPNSSEGLLLGQHVFIEPDYGQTLVDGGLHLNAAYVCGNEDDGYYVWAASKKDTIEKNSQMVQEKAGSIMRELRDLDKESKKQMDQLDYKTGMFAIGHHVNEVQVKYEQYERVISYIKDVQEDVLENIGQFVDEEEETEDGLSSLLPMLSKKPAEDVTLKYKVNLIVDHSKSKGAPVVVTFNPSYNNLVGEVEYDSEFGNLTTDFMKIKSGLFHKANGGYLIVQAQDILTMPQAWEALRRVIKTKEINMDSIREQLGAVVAPTLKPEPIPLTSKLS